MSVGATGIPTAVAEHAASSQLGLPFNTIANFCACDIPFVRNVIQTCKWTGLPDPGLNHIFPLLTGMRWRGFGGATEACHHRYFRLVARLPLVANAPTGAIQLVAGFSELPNLLEKRRKAESLASVPGSGKSRFFGGQEWLQAADD